MIAYRDLVRHALARDVRIAVWDGEEWAVRVKSGMPSKFNEVVEAIKSVEECSLRFFVDLVGPVRPKEPKLLDVGWAYVILPGPGHVSDEESVADFSGDFVDAWFDDFYERCS